MKKVFLGLIAAGLMASSASASTINKVVARADGLLIVYDTSTVKFITTSARAKDIYAMALTALAGGKNVEVQLSGGYVVGLTIVK